MASRFLLYTSALLAHSRQEPGWAQVQALFEANDLEILAASVTLTEFARRLCELGATVSEARHTVESYLELLARESGIPLPCPLSRITSFMLGPTACAPSKCG